MQKFNDPSVAIDERISDLISRLTLEEKAGLLKHEADGVERLGVPAYNWWNEALHGVARAGKATIFPQALTMAATFDAELLQEVASAISDEGRAKFQYALEKKGKTDRYQGLTYWTPNINIYRDPRWGRGQETYGEDPYLTGELGAAFVRGLQQEKDGVMKAAGCAKHFAVHSGPEALRHEFDAKPSKQDLHQTYLPAFKRLVDEGVESVMGAYNRVLGEPACAHSLLLEEILRNKWGFKGHVVSDCWAIRDFYEFHGVAKDAVEAASLAIKKGCDLNCGCVYESLVEAVKSGSLTEADLDICLERLLRTAFKLGLFDPAENNPYKDIPLEVVDCKKHRKLACEVAEKGIVLLKNSDNLLPFKQETVKYIYVAGPLGADNEAMIGNYYGTNGRIVSVLEGVAERAGFDTKVDFRHGCLIDRPNPNPIDWASFEASEADVVLGVMGITGLIEGEEGDAVASHHRGDHEDITFPEHQLTFLKNLKSRGKPVVLVVGSGSPMILTEAKKYADAIIYMGIPGEEGGTALAKILFGDVNPSGRLPVTFPRSMDQLPPYDDYSMKNRTYRYMTSKPLFPFGYGLSYTTFSYGDMSLSGTSLDEGETLTVSAKITNSGELAGRELVQLYLRPPAGDDTIPGLSLVGVKPLELKRGESQTVTFSVAPDQFAYADENGEFIRRKGDWKVLLAQAAPVDMEDELGILSPLSETLTIM